MGTLCAAGLALLGPVDGVCAEAAAAGRPTEGAVGLIVQHGPAFPGSADFSAHVMPAGFLRYGRVTFSGAGGFTTRGDGEIERGLAAELARRGKLRLSLGLRHDSGRKAADSPELAGLGDIRRTLRGRLSARWNPEPEWHLVGGLSVDALRRGGGYFADLSLSRRWPLSGGDSVHLGLGLTGAGDRYLQAWHGVTPQQSASSGLPAFTASEGLSSVWMSATWRTEFAALGQPFAASAEVRHSRLLGSAADSPLTRRVAATSVGGAVVWRF